MRFSHTPIIGIDALHHLLRTEQSVWFNDGAFPMYPLGLNGIQPRTFTRQPASYEAYPLSRLLDCTIVVPQPRPDLVADVPRRVVPDQQHGSEPLRCQARAAPGQKRRRLAAHWTALHKTQQQVFRLGGHVAEQQTV